VRVGGKDFGTHIVRVDFAQLTHCNAQFYWPVKDRLKVFCREELEGFAQNSAMAEICFEVGPIQLAKETTGFLGRNHEYGESG
jgi:hypothetical protein